MKISRILLAAALAVAFVSATFAADREQFTVSELTVETSIDMTGGTISNGTLAGVTLTSPTISAATIVGTPTVGALAVTTNITLSATAGRVLLGTNVGVSASVLMGTNIVKIMNGIITATGQ